MTKKTAKMPAKRIENPSWLTQPATGGLNRPPTRSRLQVLPFNELAWENFERLCYRLARLGGDVEQWAALYGGRGQKQDGIDIYVRRPDVPRYACWQSKRRDRLTIGALKAAIVEFEQGEWLDKSDEFVICTSASIQDTKLQSEIETQTARLRTKNLAFRVLGQTELSTELKDIPALVRDFFGREWARDFAGIDEDGDASLDVADIATVRAELQKLYVSNFSSIDPGIVTTNTGQTGGSGLLPLLDRFVEPDIEVADTGSPTEAPSPPIRPTTSANSDLAVDTSASDRTVQLAREVLRRQVSRWVAEDEYSVIVGDAGLGKSTTLRAFALDMLGDGACFPAVAQRWADCVPIVIPFAFWVRLVESRESDVSLTEAVKIWFKKFDVSDALLVLIIRSLDQQKALLLIDGLDEWSNESAARSTLALLVTFVKTKRLPAILTGRPGGLTRLGALDPILRQSRLAVLSETQQRTITAIWFGHLHPTGSDTASVRERIITTQVSNFFSDLAQAGTLLTLSGVPLLLSGLISLHVRQVALPRSRFQAYRELIELLLEIHPNRRAQAALDRASRLTILADPTLRRQTLADLAYHKRQQGYDAGCPVGEARTVVIEYLESLDGAGLPAHDAIAGARELLSVDADTTGLLIEKAPQEIGFIHAVFEESLVGLHLAGWRLQDQEEFVRTHGGDPRWSTSILAMLHALTRPSDIDVLLRIMTVPELSATQDVVRQTLLAEAVFGDFRCSPRLAAELTPAFIRLVTTENWFPQREAVFRLILEGALSGGAREGTRTRLQEWFPDPLKYRDRVYSALRHWPRNSALELLWLGLFNDQPQNKRAAAAALTTLFAGDGAVGDRLHALFLSVADGQTLCAVLEALMQGWWDEGRLPPMIAAARKSEHLHLRLAGIRGRIKMGLQDDVDLDELISMADDNRYRIGSELTGLSQTLATGWPNDPRVIRAALTGATKDGRRAGISAEVAKAYLLHFSQTNTELDNKVGEMIRKDEFFFSPSFGSGYIQGQYGPAVRAAVDYRIEHTNHHMHNDIAHLALMSRSTHAKKILIELLKDDHWVFWPVYGLLEGWGMADTETSAALLAIAAGPPERVQYFAHHLPGIIANGPICRSKLLEIARLRKVERLDFLLAGFRRLGSSPEDTEIMEAVLKHDYSRRGIFDATSDLIAAFGTHPTVRSMALARLRELDAPWEALIETYAADDEIRGAIRRYLSSLPVALRSVLVSALGRRATDDFVLKERLLNYRLDSSAAVRTASAIAYYEAIGDSAEERATAMTPLCEEVVAIGPSMDLIRQAAFAGFIALDELATFRELLDYGDKKAHVDAFTFDNNRQLLAYIAKYWERLTVALGSELMHRLSRYGGNEWWCWDHLASFVSESAAIRGDFLAYCARETKVLSSRAIEALAREMPRSRLLREHCLRGLAITSPQDNNASPYDHQRRQFVIGRILGRQFAGDAAVRNELEQCAWSRLSAAIAGLTLAWKDSPILESELGLLRSNEDPHRRYWPDVAHLIGTFGSQQEFCSFLLRFLRTSSGGIWDFMPFCIEPIVARIRIDDGIVAHLIAQLKVTDSGSDKASIPRLLAMANQMTSELRAWCEKSLAKQSDHAELAEFGLDIIVGEIRPVAHALLDALSPNRL